jgi:hypothetical protein
MQKEKLPMDKVLNRGLVFTVSVPANGVVAVQVPLGADIDLIEAQQRRERLASLVEAEARVETAAAEVAELKALLGHTD